MTGKRVKNLLGVGGLIGYVIMRRGRIAGRTSPEIPKDDLYSLLCNPQQEGAEDHA